MRFYSKFMESQACLLIHWQTEIIEMDDIEEIREAAEIGFCDEQYQLGIYYDQGNRPKSAFKWYKRAMDNGNVPAIFAVAMCYRYGFGVDKNLKTAFKLMRKFALNNCEAPWRDRARRDAAG